MASSVLLWIMLGSASPLFAQARIAAAAPPSVEQAPPPPPTPAQQPPHRAQVTYAQGQIAVAADNSSLNQILREISQQTGIKITGGVQDERVFGKYGPAPAAEVLASLLDGTGSNVLLAPGEAGSAGELILTPRHGGPTPPNPNAMRDEPPAQSYDAVPTPPEQPQQEPPQQSPPPQPAPEAASPAATAPPATPAADPADPSSTTPATSTTPNDPNAVKTPQQIYEQLQRMRQQQAQPEE
ncbi:MAG TPA: hypothetical protein VGC07_09255 [Granulicella sp.]